MKNYKKLLDVPTNLLLNEIAEDYKVKIINYIVEEENVPIDEIKLQDLIKANELLSRKYNTREEKRKRMYRSIGLLGIFYAVVGLSIILFDTVRMDLSEFSQIGLLIIMSGLSLTMLTFLFSIYKNIFSKSFKQRYKDTISADYKALFMTNWSVLEEEARKINKDNFSETNTNPNKLFESLEKNAIIDSMDMEKLKKLLSYRNNIVHGFNDGITKQDMKKALDSIDAIIEKLSK